MAKAGPTLVCSATTQWFVWGDVGSSELHFYVTDTQVSSSGNVYVSNTSVGKARKMVEVSSLD